eukprot:scaffold1491_cov167-Ochromonas_danica.AAC.6
MASAASIVQSSEAVVRVRFVQPRRVALLEGLGGDQHGQLPRGISSSQLPQGEEDVSLPRQLLHRPPQGGVSLDRQLFRAQQQVVLQSDEALVALCQEIEEPLAHLVDLVRPLLMARPFILRLPSA